jgi:hypothetical protein
MTHGLQIPPFNYLMVPRKRLENSRGSMTMLRSVGDRTGWYWPVKRSVLRSGQLTKV